MLTADWVAPNATVIGDVTLDSGSSLWHTVILRGDTAKIRVGKNTIIQDRTLIKSSNRGGEINIGNNVFIGTNCQIDECHLDDFSYVGMGATIHKGVTVEPYAVVAAGAVVPEGTTIPSGQVFAGNPGKYLRDVTQEEKHQISEYMIEMQQLSQIYSEECEKDFRQQIDTEDERVISDTMDPIDKASKILADMGLPTEMEDYEYIEHRALSQYSPDVGGDKNLFDEKFQEDEDERTWNPYEQDLSKFPEILKMYGENYERYEQVKARFENEKPGEQHASHPIDPIFPTSQDAWEKKYDDYRVKK